MVKAVFSGDGDRQHHVDRRHGAAPDPAPKAAKAEAPAAAVQPVTPKKKKKAAKAEG